MSVAGLTTGVLCQVPALTVSEEPPTKMSPESSGSEVLLSVAVTAAVDGSVLAIVW